MEQERDHAHNYAKKIEAELKKTKEVSLLSPIPTFQVLQKNQLNLIEPLQNKIAELEIIVDQKEADIKKRYKWKLRKYKREIEMERQINLRLKSKISRENSTTKFRDESS